MHVFDMEPAGVEINRQICGVTHHLILPVQFILGMRIKLNGMAD